MSCSTSSTEFRADLVTGVHEAAVREGLDETPHLGLGAPRSLHSLHTVHLEVSVLVPIYGKKQLL